MADPALNEINRKTWKQTKPIMICNVLAFFCIMGVFVCWFFNAGWKISIFFISMNAIFICLSVHNAWVLEESL